jgi:DNA-binding GntR family transcriptional regulator
MADLLEGLVNGPMAVRTSEGVAHVLRKAILSGALPPGQPLRERQLAEELKVSRTPVREALFNLQGEGLVDLTPSKYARVREVTPSDIAQIYSLRRVLEAYSARCAAERKDVAMLEKVEDALAAQRRLGASGSLMEQAQADLAFHEAIAAAAGSRLLTTVLHQVLAVTVTLRSRYKYKPNRAERVCQQHGEILRAIKDGDADEAESLMSEHIAESSRLADEHLKTNAQALE